MCYSRHNCLRRFPIRSADGLEVAFQSKREGDLAIFKQRADGTTPAERLTKAGSGIEHRPESWSPTGSPLSFTAIKGTSAAIWTIDLRDRYAKVFAEAPGKFVAKSTFSPDGRWIAYASNESGTSEIFVQPWPQTGARYQVGASSRTGRQQVWWAPDGKELFYNEGPELWFGVPVTTAPTISFGVPLERPRGGALVGGTGNVVGISGSGPRGYDITPNGQHMIALVSGEDPDTHYDIHVVLNWTEELNRRVPTR